MLRVYNEGDIDGYAAEIKDHLPPYLEFVNDEFNKQYGWELSEDGRTVTTKYLENSLITKAQTDKDGKIVLSYKEVPIMCKVSEKAKTSQNITNIADITKYLDKNKEYYLKEGDIVTVSVKNINQTIAQQLKNFFYSVIGEEVYVIAALHGGIVLATGQ